MEFILHTTQKVEVSINPVDAKGNAARIDGTPEWASTNPSILTVSGVQDGKLAIVSAVGVTGNATITVKADADLGPGVKTIGGSLDFFVTDTITAHLPISVHIPTSKGT